MHGMFTSGERTCMSDLALAKVTCMSMRHSTRRQLLKALGQPRSFMVEEMREKERGAKYRKV